MTVQDIHPSVAAMEIVCAETAAPPTAMVVFGASGDLVTRKLLPSLAQIQERGLLSEHFCLIGCGRTEYSDGQFRRIARDALGEHVKGLSHDIAASFVERLYYVSGDYNDPALYQRIKDRLDELRHRHDIHDCDVFYLAVPPVLYGSIAEHLGAAGLSCKDQPDCHQQARLVVEKPFGRDLASATELNRVLDKWFKEEQIYRIDHYLGKETVQNIMIF
ncbi:MAG: hypothetical protein RBR19_09185, partial [Sedimentisphaerales bacterium]|nr:hypothetical protein [Sedimentisphaerales bacterium]